MKNISIFLGRRFITNIIITFFAFVLNEPLVFGAQNAGATQPDDEIKMVVEKIYNLVLPIAVAIAVIKLLIALFTLATSQGDPGKLNNVKEEILSVISGLLVIVGVVTLIKIISSSLGGI